MTDPRDSMDSTLQGLFDAAREETAGADFVAQVMARVDAKRRNTMLGWAALGLVLLPIGWLLTSPLQIIINLITQFLPTQLLSIENQVLAQLVGPLNTAAVPIGFGLLFAMYAYRKIFR